MPSRRSSIRRDLFFGVLAIALVFASALMFGGPFLSANTHSVISANRSPVHKTIVNGTIKRNGDRVYLSEVGGKLYQLDHAAQLAPYDGMFVMVTGRLNSQSMLIQVERVVQINA